MIRSHACTYTCLTLFECICRARIIQNKEKKSKVIFYDFSDFTTFSFSFLLLSLSLCRLSLLFLVPYLLPSLLLITLPCSSSILAHFFPSTSFLSYLAGTYTKWLSVFSSPLFSAAPFLLSLPPLSWLLRLCVDFYSVLLPLHPSCVKGTECERDFYSFATLSRRLQHSGVHLWMSILCLASHFS